MDLKATMVEARTGCVEEVHATVAGMAVIRTAESGNRRQTTGGTCHHRPISNKDPAKRLLKSLLVVLLEHPPYVWGHDAFT